MRVAVQLRLMATRWDATGCDTRRQRSAVDVERADTRRSDMVRVVFLKYDGRAHRSYPARWLSVSDSDGPGWA